MVCEDEGTYWPVSPFLLKSWVVVEIYQYSAQLYNKLDTSPSTFCRKYNQMLL